MDQAAQVSAGLGLSRVRPERVGDGRARYLKAPVQQQVRQKRLQARRTAKPKLSAFIGELLTTGQKWNHIV